MQVKVGLLGEIRSGKDTVAMIIAEELKKVTGVQTDEFAFSDGIHDVINLTMPERYFTGKPRHELQHIGQSLRELKPDVWIEYLFNSEVYTHSTTQSHHIIVTDVRQANEAVALKEKGFFLLKVGADLETRIKRMQALGDNYKPHMLQHETEQAVNECIFDYYMDNSGTLEELRAAIVEWLHKEVLTDAY